MRRKRRFRPAAVRPASESAAPSDLERRGRTLDEKLDEALELTFPASDAFVIV